MSEKFNYYLREIFSVRNLIPLSVNIFILFLIYCLVRPMGDFGPPSKDITGSTNPLMSGDLFYEEVMDLSESQALELSDLTGSNDKSQAKRLKSLMVVQNDGETLIFDKKSGLYSEGPVYLRPDGLDIKHVATVILNDINESKTLIYSNRLDDRSKKKRADAYSGEEKEDTEPEQSGSDHKDLSKSSNPSKNGYVLDEDQKKKLSRLLTQRIKSKQNESSHSDSGMELGADQSMGGSPDLSNESTQNDEESGSDSIERSNKGKTGGLTDSQINVSEISETKTNVFYKGAQLPKLGFNKKGEMLSEEKKEAQGKMVLNRIKQAGDSWSIHYPAIGETRKTIAIFGDPTCPICSRQHQYIDKLRSEGVEIFYLLYNRSLSPAGVGTPKVSRTNRNIERIWCSPNRKKALSEAFMNHGQYTGPSDCSNLSEKGISDFPGGAHYLMGRLIGMNGTPYAITDSGEVLRGFSKRGQPESFMRRIGIL